MELTALLTYMTALAALTLTPGPLIAVLAARSASNDRPGACALAIGVCAGDILVILAICAGLGFWLQVYPAALAVARYCGAGLLLWMAVRTWRGSGTPADHPAAPGGLAALALGGFAICLGSPQTIMLYLVLLPGVADLSAIQPPDVMLLVVATVIVLLGVFLVVILLAGATQRLLRSPAGVTLWSRVMSVTIAASAGWVILS